MTKEEFERIWAKFHFILDEMKDGQFFFEGYVPNVNIQNIKENLLSLVDEDPAKLIFNNVWADDSPDLLIKKNHSIEEYILLFEQQKIVTLSVDYDKVVGNEKLELRLNFNCWNDRCDLEAICYRNSILGSKSPKEAIYQALLHFGILKKAFDGQALFIAESINDFPENINEYPDDWVKIDG